MNQLEALIERFSGRKPLVNIILDGYGIGKADESNAIHLASAPFMDLLTKDFAGTSLFTHGRHVGLPGETDMGGSEVGHLTIGAGKIISQGATLISNAIKDGSFFQSAVLKEALNTAQSGALHLLGLLSDGNVHSHIDHFEAVIKEAVRLGVKKCYVHALLDGRDVGVQSADIYVQQLDRLFEKILSDHPDWDYGIASGGGREVITMDRDKTWPKVEAGWNTHVLGKSGNYFASALEAIQYFREQTPDLIDQDCPSFNIHNTQGDIPTIQDGDAVIFMNFRGDRAVELTMALTEDNFSGFKRNQRPSIYFAGMMVYDEDNNIPQNQIMESAHVENPFGKRILELGLNQFRLAETQKYAHVTFFFNGGYRKPLDPNKEIYHLVESDKIESFALAPQMKAAEIAGQAVEFIQSGQHEFGLINFANADMVGHTGDMKAAIKAVETVDTAVKQICDAVRKANGLAIITADHGNADEMIITNKKTGKAEVSTKHSLNPVPFVIYDPAYQGDYRLKQLSDESVLDLSMIAATNFLLLGQKVPDDLNDSLFLI